MANTPAVRWGQVAAAFNAMGRKERDVAAAAARQRDAPAMTALKAKMKTMKTNAAQQPKDIAALRKQGVPTSRGERQQGDSRIDCVAGLAGERNTLNA